MPKKNKYVRAAEKVLLVAEDRLKDYKGSCDDCKWKGKYAGAGDYECNNPVVILASENQTDSYNRTQIRGIQEQRDESSLWGDVVCGPDGMLFEPKTPVIPRVGFFKKLFS